MEHKLHAKNRLFSLLVSSEKAVTNSVVQIRLLHETARFKILTRAQVSSIREPDGSSEF